MTDPQPSGGKLILRLAPMIYGPTLIFALGEGAVIPLIPTMATGLGASLAATGAIASALVIGKLCGNLPSSWVVARLGERIAMSLASLVAMVGALGMLFAPNVAVLTIAIFILGIATSAFGLARHAFMATRVPFTFRARALSLLGGTFRLGTFVGPFVGALMLGLTGHQTGAIWFLVGCIVVTFLLVWFGPDPETEFAARVQPQGTATSPIPLERDGIIGTMIKHRTVLSRIGVSAATLSAIRSARDIVLPIWGVSIGLDAQTILIVVGVAGALDFALFYVSGQVMDRFGRLWAVAPAMLLMAFGFLALSLTHDLGAAGIWFAVFAAVIGLGNGLSSGILMTLGADLAPRHDPAPFLGSWRTLTDSGAVLAPLAFSGIAAVAPIMVATGVMGGIGLVGVAGFLRWLPIFVPRKS
ncbi:MFS transporter [Leucobacter denitrificans]|uniref:MFS transporter n=1 Tax=Leucobacter denitrificans TaxID=683042 RepID=A0A7G9S259_9MICO|nr:MFS transporter [Leucobacter denitrificans]QNN61934.1 MFS transporter [Leucobacter denitrificans]